MKPLDSALLRLLLCGLVASSAFVAVRARAQTQQPWLSDRRFGEGPGILSGNLEIHPGLAAEVGYDSNFFQAAGEAANPLWTEPIVEAARLRVTPSLSLRTLGPERRAADGPDAAPPKASFELGAVLRLDRVFALDDNDESPADGTLFGGDVGAEVEIGPSEPVSTALGVSFSRIGQPSNEPSLLGDGLSRRRYGGHADVRWRPGGGIFSWSVGYAGSVTQFDNVEFRLNRAEHGFRTQGRYRFLPRTAMVYEGELGVVTQLHTGSRQGNAAPISSQLGLNGLVTPRLSVLLMGGLKAMFFETTPSGSWDDFDGGIGRAELTWFLGAAPEGEEGPGDRGLSHLRVGAQRDVFPGGIGNYYELNRGFGELSMVFAGVVGLRARGGFAVVVHATPRDDDGQPLSIGGGEVTEQRPEAGLYVEYRIVPTIALLANAEFTASQPDNFVIVDTATFQQDNLSFTRFALLAGARWFL